MIEFNVDQYALIERCLLLACLIAALVCLFFGASNSAVFAGGFAQLLLLFWVWLLAFYLAIVLPLIVLGGYLQKQWQIGTSYFRTLLLLSFGYLLVITGFHYPGDLISLPGFLQPYGTLATVVLIIAAILTVYFWNRRRNLVRGIQVVALSLFVSAVVFGAHQRGSSVPTVPDSTIQGGQSEVPLIVIGLDGADWDYIDPLIRKGKLPTLRKLRRTGSWGNLKTTRPTKSPILWTSIATGTRPDKHRINDFVGYRIFGSDHLFPRPRLMTGTGLNLLFPYIVKGTAPLNNTHRRRFSYWELASAVDRPVSVLNWWMTWPSEPFFGQMISERIHFRGFGYTRTPDESRLTFPPDLLEPALSHLYKPGEVDYEDWKNYMQISREEYRRLSQREFKHHDLAGEFPFLISMLESNARLADLLIDHGKGDFDRTPDLMVLFRGTDLAGHMGLKYSDLVKKPPGISEELRAKFGGFVTNVYSRLDRALGEILKRYDNPNIVVVSDHGFERRTKGKNVIFGHKRAPDGIWLASGPAFKNDYRGAVNIYQVLPLMLKTAGIPVANDLAGTVPKGPFSGLGEEPEPNGGVDSYGIRLPAGFQSGRSKTNRRIKDHLKGLGYL